MENEKKHNGWKITAIIFICIFIIETISVIWIWNLGYNTIKNEELCSSKCLSIGGYSYQIGDYAQQCICYNDNREVIKVYDMKE